MPSVQGTMRVKLGHIRKIPSTVPGTRRGLSVAQLVVISVTIII